MALASTLYSARVNAIIDISSVYVMCSHICSRDVTRRKISDTCDQERRESNAGNALQNYTISRYQRQ
jgi:hypothetical protein